ncbi:hypothetical protein [Mixta calida]|uniref:hypothetical protein n=1 Tax=Mixta calida TaxID=665913 RepID=UPI002FD9DA99
MKMTNEERQALIIALKMLEPEIKAIPIPALSKAIEISLAALTAEPARVPDESTLPAEHIAWMEQSLPRNTFSEEEWEEISLYTWLAWRDSRRSAGNTDIKRLAFIDSPAQQYEALAGWKVVPIEPTWEMLAADGCSKHHEGQECSHHENRKRIWRAMLEASPVITDNEVGNA